MNFSQFFPACLLILSITSTCAFTVPRMAARISPSTSARYTNTSPETEGETEEVKKTPANPDYPDLPELKGDFNWDEKFANDDDWITENVPGRIVLNEIALAEQCTSLDKLEEKWSKVKRLNDYNDARILGWTERAETYNGRYAMFFLTVGLLTEYWTGVSMPGQVEEMLRVGGIIGFE